MYILGNVIMGLAVVADSILFAYTIIIFASVIMSWVNADPYNQIVRMVNMLTEPVYRKVHRKIPTSIGGLDLTPIIILLAIQFVQIAIVSSMKMFAVTLGA